MDASLSYVYHMWDHSTLAQRILNRVCESVIRIADGKCQQSSILLLTYVEPHFSVEMSDDMMKQLRNDEVHYENKKNIARSYISVSAGTTASIALLLTDRDNRSCRKF